MDKQHREGNGKPPSITLAKKLLLHEHQHYVKVVWHLSFITLMSLILRSHKTCLGFISLSLIHVKK